MPWRIATPRLRRSTGAPRWREATIGCRPIRDSLAERFVVTPDDFGIPVRHRVALDGREGIAVAIERVEGVQDLVFRFDQRMKDLLFEKLLRRRRAMALRLDPQLAGRCAGAGKKRP